MAEIFRIDGSFDHSLFEGVSCAFGVFDGVHRGHQFLLAQAISSAHELRGTSAALTFDVDPDELFKAASLKKLMTNEDRIDALAHSGVDTVFVLPFSQEFAAQSPKDFLAHTFGVYAPKSIHVGEDARFGNHASGTVADLREWGSPRGTSIHAWQLRESDGGPISATRIRGLLSQGAIEAANALLGHHYYQKGVVYAGRGEGADMGFRTANMLVPEQFRALADGVYAAYAFVDGARYKAAVNVGVAPMFEGATATIEAHLLDFDGDLYGKEVRVEFTNWLREMKTFDSVDTLITTVKNNIAWVRENL